MIERVEGAPCWWYSYGGDPEGPHFATRKDADQALGMPPGGVLLQLSKPCHTVTCDGCGYVEGEHDSSGYHFPADDPTRVVAYLDDVLPNGQGAMLCSDCRTDDEAVVLGDPLPGMAPVRGGGLR